MKRIKENFYLGALGNGVMGSPFDQRGLGGLPRKTNGSPSCNQSVDASRLQQKVMTDDDIEYWAGDPEDPDSCGASFCKPLKLKKTYADQDIEGIKIESLRLLRKFIREEVEKIVDEDGYSDMDKEEPMDEFSALGAGAISGHSGGSGGPPRVKKTGRKPV